MLHDEDSDDGDSAMYGHYPSDFEPYYTGDVRASRGTTRAWAIVILLAVLGIVGWAAYEVLAEAFGSYGR